MTDYGYGVADEELAEVRKLEEEVQASPDEFENWEKLVRAVEGLEGGLNRNSSPQAITAARSIYDRFLAKFPLFFGYWKKYADLEFAIAGTEAAEMVYERGVASISISVDLWANYCSFKVETTHDDGIIRELFERGAACVGLDFLAHPFWDKYIEFEERLEAQDKVFDILGRIINIPMHQYARYFEKYRQLAASRPLTELAPSDLLNQFSTELEPETNGKSQIEVERAIRTRLDAYHLELFHNTQTETTKRWTYEQEIKRPYFHVTELDEPQLENWSKYLDFEESEADYIRTTFLYERCVVTCAHYDDFWQRYARWMYGQDGKEEEVRNIFQRASCIYTPIARPAIRLHWALFEEACARPLVAAAIYEAILVTLPGNLEAITRLANLQRRQIGYDAAVQIYDQYLADDECTMDDKGALVVEMARLAWKSKGDAAEGRDILSRQQHIFLDSPSFWAGYLGYEIEQSTALDTAAEQAERVKALHSTIRQKTRLPADVVRDLSQKYLSYLTEKQSKAAAREYLELDMQVNGPASVTTAHVTLGAKRAVA
ncbi:hypothetical protein AUEXF2481DRAFT_43694 [Aureobasidium subglaciale EXF-2481]|uniref:Suppressor of forked domain-containing protein n=1 Tax=Aureobasidium subglaciale (strain EXF-2481) TaxID=1043005 RepID=A0A074Y228_AURSE|nr:uncharacterized protein AUEXF2481DRAFT_43694 [Aureobasidium subglaciale EXF-2481]KAI5195507.1 hypothetical protein E4T38_09031 [Aureobasidium subglaciale]KAI5214495.1 hypothetical protein E4T40_08980 [Aureobasidium subglaciale]KAI5217239.1 hypothetical protein E4T41_08939 [Aureobasidium subglaciale]KAI5254986.1 hypothetical protein E4T46_08973 [Aureobasidium subglaciale]KEQ91765.1 hypothetical protein AUEXF2481DRAFT_43694 [Aureobasidium subglaciale EXF-2481]